MQQELLALSNHEIDAAAAPAQPEYFDAFATAWHSDYRAPKGRRKTTTKHWWRTRADPFAESWPLVESWLMAEPNITAKELMTRLSQPLARPLSHRRTTPDPAAAREGAGAHSGPDSSCSLRLPTSKLTLKRRRSHNADHGGAR